MPDTIPADILDAPVEGLNLQGGTVGDQLGDAPTLVVFLRHFGCAFCRETVSDLRRLAGEQPAYPPILFVFLGTTDEVGEILEATGLEPERLTLEITESVLMEVSSSNTERLDALNS